MIPYVLAVLLATGQSVSAQDVIVPTPPFGGSVSGNSNSPQPAPSSIVSDAIISGTPAFASSGPAGKKSSGGQTSVAVPKALEVLAELGGVPKSLETLRLLEAQQRRVAQRATATTVSVQIGPAQGCGVIISQSGYILTAAHVAMRPGEDASITLSDGREYRATTLGMNRGYDAGLLKIDPGQGNEWSYASLGRSEAIVPGMWCVAVGHPGGYDAQRGPVTRVGRILEVAPDTLLTDCALIGGDSGGPLFDLSGRLIAIHSRIGNDITENLHVPIDRFASSWTRMQKGDAYGFLPGFRPTLGVRGKSSYKVARIHEVRPGSPGAMAGLQAGDVIVRFGKENISDFRSLIKAVANTMPGERVAVWYDRDGDRYRVIVEIGRQP
ncbi:MAG: trypsin-like peptidase domain-containing protein [Planctomycetota bacterium]